MALTLRKVLFWPHLISGILAGLVIGMMCLTGTAIAFEEELLAWADADARTVVLPAEGATRLPVEELVRRAEAESPGKRVSGILLSSNPTEAVRIDLGRDEGVYADPYTGALTPIGNEVLHDLFRTLIEWHRYLGMSGDQRPIGKAITGASNLLFLFLALSGLYLWWPTKWRWSQLKSTTWFRRGLKGKARDFNWHNVFGFWTLPVMVVLIASGVVISYSWASAIPYRMFGEEPPVRRGPPGRGAGIPVTPPSADASPLPLQQLFSSVASRHSGWETIALRIQQPPAAATGGENKSEGAGGTDKRARGGERPTDEAPRALASQFVVRLENAWPPFASTQVALNPFTAEVVQTQSFEDATPGRSLRIWLRFLHTGEALGFFGKSVAALVSLAGLLLVWTGFALSWRRFFGHRRSWLPTREQ